MRHFRCGESLIVVLLLFGCSRQDQDQFPDGRTAVGGPVTGDWIIVRSFVEPETLNPLLSNTAAAREVQYGANLSRIAETLLQYDTDTWTLTKPLLAASPPDISPDRLTYTFTMREGVQWHDGGLFSAEDVLFSVKMMMSPLADTAAWRTAIGDLKDVQIVDSNKILFTFGTAYFLNAENMGSLPILPKHVLDPAGVLNEFTYKDVIGPRGASDANIKKLVEDLGRTDFSRRLVGTGPYTFEKWDGGRELVLRRNENYWGEKAYLDKIIYRFISDETAALTALKAGDVDFTRLTPIQHVQQTSGDLFESRFAKLMYTVPRFFFIAWNSERAYFKDKRVRQALTMLVDRKQLIETILFGLAEETVSNFSPKSADYNHDLKPYPFDPIRAARLLDEAGWKDTNGDGVRDKDGIPFRFEFLGRSNDGFVDKLIPILGEEFRKAGIDMRARKLEFTVLTQNLRDHKYDAARGLGRSVCAMAFQRNSEQRSQLRQLPEFGSR
jgi:peptide/nickel transport system substrate-binding protein